MTWQYYNRLFYWFLWILWSSLRSFALESHILHNVSSLEVIWCCRCQDVAGCLIVRVLGGRLAQSSFGLQWVITNVWRLFLCKILCVVNGHAFLTTLLHWFSVPISFELRMEKCRGHLGCDGTRILFLRFKSFHQSTKGILSNWDYGNAAWQLLRRVRHASRWFTIRNTIYRFHIPVWCLWKFLWLLSS